MYGLAFRDVHDCSNISVVGRESVVKVASTFKSGNVEKVRQRRSLPSPERLRAGRSAFCRAHVLICTLRAPKALRPCPRKSTSWRAWPGRVR